MTPSELGNRQDASIEDHLADTVSTGPDASISDIRRLLQEARLLDVPDIRRTVERLCEEGAVRNHRSGYEFLEQVLGEVMRSQSLIREVIRRLCQSKEGTGFTFGDRGIIIRRLDRMGAIGEGEGEFGDVYLIYFIGDEKPAVVKVCKPVSGEELRRNVFRFEREIALAEKLSERGVVPRVLGKGVEDRGLPYYCMEYLEGNPLHRIMHPTRPLPSGFVIDSLVVWMRMLQEFQKLDIVHRDLKPANLFLCDDGSWRVLDLGLGTSKDLPSITKSTDGLLGNLRYMAPEQLRGPKHAKPPADLYAMASISYHAVTGRPTVPGDTQLAIQHAHATGYEPDLDPVHEKHEELAQALRMMLHRDPDSRKTPDHWISALYDMSSFPRQYNGDFEAFLRDPVSELRVQMPPRVSGEPYDDLVIGSRFDPQTLSASLRTLYPPETASRRRLFNRREMLITAAAIAGGGGGLAAYSLLRKQNARDPNSGTVPNANQNLPSIQFEMDGDLPKRLILFSEDSVEISCEENPKLYASFSDGKEYLCGEAFVCTPSMIARMLKLNNENELDKKHARGRVGFHIFSPGGMDNTVYISGLALFRTDRSGRIRLYSDDPQLLRARQAASGLGGSMSFYDDDAIRGDVSADYPTIARTDPKPESWPAPWSDARSDLGRSVNAQLESLERRVEERKGVITRTSSRG